MAPDALVRAGRDGRPLAAHWLRHNQLSRMPRRHVFIDTEAMIALTDGGQSQTWALGALETYDCDPRKKAPVLTAHDCQTPARLWELVDAFTRPGVRTLVWAHNLAYDLRLADAFTHLPALGWRLDGVSMDGRAVWARWRREAATLQFADSMSWLPCALAEVASDLGVSQAPLPADPADTEGLYRRCRRDVEVLRLAVTTIMAWIAADDLGNFQTTGAGQAMSAFRHRFMSHQLLVHNDQPALDMERRAVWPGRTEAWQHGQLTAGPYIEYDLPRAYCQIAHDCTVPTRLLGHVPHIDVDQFWEWRDERAILAHVDVDTDVPLVPVEHDGRIIWPTGRFTTTLWDPEIALLIEHGADVTVRDACAYQRAPALHDWAAWILAALEPAAEGVTALQRRILKHWSRALIGRFGLRYRAWQVFGESPDTDVSVSRFIDANGGPASQMLQVGHQLLDLGALQEGENALPQVTGWITSECRRRLWQITSLAGAENVVYMDTDSVIVTERGARRLDMALAEAPVWGLAVKRSIRALDVRGPRNITADGELRVSGVPRRSRTKGERLVVGEQWESLGRALARGARSEVRVWEREFQLADTDQRRAWLPDGRTRPLAIGT